MRLSGSVPSWTAGTGRYIEGETRPWVVLCGEPYEFTTAEAAIAKARELSTPD